MHDNLRHCLPSRVAAMVQALTQDKSVMLSAMSETGGRCSDHQGCALKDACQGIHEAFKPPRR